MPEKNMVTILILLNALGTLYFYERGELFRV